MTALHPAKFSPRIVGVGASYLRGYDRVLDPFGGTGRVHDLSVHFQKHYTVALDIEPEWAVQCGMRSNACAVPFKSGSFDAIFTSPVYGNRMSDHHNARDASKRNTYTHVIGHELHAMNAGHMAFGTFDYGWVHVGAWQEAWRVLRPGGRFVLNTKDFYQTRRRVRSLVRVTEWHTDVLLSLGFKLVGGESVLSPGNRFGANGLSRVDSEDVLVFDKPRGVRVAA